MKNKKTWCDLCEKEIQCIKDSDKLWVCKACEIRYLRPSTKEEKKLEIKAI
jgi:hypothetical protein